MQASNLKKIIFFIILIVLSPQLSKSQKYVNSLKKADSLFLHQNFNAAEQIYEENLSKIRFPSSKLYLKLAFIKEQKRDFLNTLYYLNKSYELKPNDKILSKLNEIAIQNDLKGYELDDFNFLVLLYKQYSGFLVAIMLVLGIYIFSVLVFKQYKKHYIPLSQKIFLLVYLIGVSILLNLPDRYHQAIVNTDSVILRDAPSSGAHAIETIDKGNRLSVLGTTDIWHRVVWHGKLMYVKESDVWLVE